MSTANRRTPGSPAIQDLVRELRTFSGEMERYIGQMSHLHEMHRTDLTAIGLVMDRDGASPKDISERLGLSPSATSAMLDRLERAGHVHREHAESDRRGVHVEVTDTALEVGQSMFGLLARHMREVLDDCDEPELVAAAALLERINTSVRAARAEAADS